MSGSPRLPRQRIALFGGSFDPVHHAHLAIAQAAVLQAGLDTVIFLPAAQSPLKSRGPSASAGQRMEMLQAATSGRSWAEVSGWELERAGPSYSWKTVEHFRNEAPESTEWFWLMGWDQWNALERWSRWEHLAFMVTFLVFGRDGEEPVSRPGVRAQFLTGQFHGSSTEVRNRIAQGMDVEDLIPPGVEAIIRRGRLYLPGCGSEK